MEAGRRKNKIFSLINVYNSFMEPKELVKKWVDVFNKADAEALAAFYADDAINHQVVTEPFVGKEAIKQMFATEFARATMVCIPENIFQDGE
jgi:ketosteroid isomerase-like protein